MAEITLTAEQRKALDALDRRIDEAARAVAKMKVADEKSGLLSEEIARWEDTLERLRSFRTGVVQQFTPKPFRSRE